MKERVVEMIVIETVTDIKENVTDKESLLVNLCTIIAIIWSLKKIQLYYWIS